MPGLGDLLGGLSELDFFTNYWETAPFFLAREQTEFYSHCLTEQEFWTLVYGRPLTPPDVRLFRGGKEISEAEYIHRDSISPAALSDLLGRGTSVVVNGIDKHVESVGRVVRLLEKRFCHPFQANAYFTPPESNAFNAHYDDHDVFVLQISGSKKWSLYDMAYERPLLRQDLDIDSRGLRAPSRELHMNAGDLLYIPRGLMHAAAAGDEASLHLTVGALVYTWAEFFSEALAEVVLREPRLRAALPPGMLARESIDSTDREIFRGLLKTIVDGADFDTTHRLFAERFALTRRAVGFRHPLSAEKIEGAQVQKYRVCPMAIFTGALEGSSYILFAHGREIRFSADMREFVESLLRQEVPISLDLIGCELGSQKKAEVLHALLSEGLIEPAP